MLGNRIKEINKLAFPAILSGISEPLISLADTAIIGHMGAEVLAAVGIASSFFLLIIWVLSQTKTAISSIVSQYYGKNRLAHIKSLVPQAIFASAFFGFVSIAITAPFSQLIFGSLYGVKDPIVLKTAIEYYAIRSLGFPLVLAIFSIYGVFRGMQNTTWAMVISLIGGSLNLVLDYLLVYGINGFVDPMGAKGAALGSVIAQCVMLSLSLVYLFKKTPYNLKLEKKAHPELNKLLGMSANLFVRTAALNVAYYLSNYFANMYGVAKIAAHTIAMQIWLFSAFFIDGYAGAGNAMAGKFLGQKKFYELTKLALNISKLALGMSIVLALAYAVSYPVVASLFTQDQAVITAFNTVFWLVILSQPINGVAFAMDGIFKGLGEAKYLRNVLMLGTLFAFIPVLLICHYFNLGLAGIWIAFIVWMGVRGGTLIWQFKRKYVPLSKAEVV